MTLSRGVRARQLWVESSLLRVAGGVNEGVHGSASHHSTLLDTLAVLDAPRGFEPRLTESESVVLPLDDGAAPLAAEGRDTNAATGGQRRVISPPCPKAHIHSKLTSSQPCLMHGGARNGRVSWRRESPVRQPCSRISGSRA